MEHSPKICPVCTNDDLQKGAKVADHFLSGEVFTLLICPQCKVQITTPQPPSDKIFSYYASDEYVSHNDSKKGLINSAYQVVKSITLRQKEKLIREFGQKGSLLDYGSGTGDFLLHCKKQGWVVNGAEPDEKARKLSQEKGLDVFDLSEINQTKNRFDVITMWHVLEHTYDPNKTVEQLKSLLKPGGILVIAVPNYSSYDAQHYGSFWAAWDVPRHLFHFHPTTITQLAEQNQMTLLQKKGMPFDAFYVSMLSEKYRGGGSLKGVLTGLKSNYQAVNSSKYSSVIYILKKEG